MYRLPLLDEINVPYIIITCILYRIEFVSNYNNIKHVYIVFVYILILISPDNDVYFIQNNEIGLYYNVVKLGTQKNV